ncbi:Uncharacterized protein FWK35_00030307 [Aphis craccivora]|uniref:Zinc finger MYM-type protein 1-like n=1 Tax=Aphis craccivora TaxID=307492 RepID=A0A6G0Y1Q3_APHCR|nr:Uncharacterized protein FWK35_00030307 [Aphis craccivora]
MIDNISMDQYTIVCYMTFILHILYFKASNAFLTSRSISSYGKVGLFKTAAAERTIKSDAALYTRLHRSKCTAIISNVIEPYFAQCLKESISDSFYSILIDESTDISVLGFSKFLVKTESCDTQTIVIIDESDDWI